MNMAVEGALTQPGKESVSRALANYLGPPALLDGEDKKAYETLHRKIIDYVKPNDVMEEILAREIIDLQWEVMRLRRLKAVVMNAEQRSAARDLAVPLSGFVEGVDLINCHPKTTPEAIAQINIVLKAAGVTPDDLAARTLERKLEHFERIDAMTAMAEGRRSRAFQDLVQHRERFAKIVKSAIKEVEDAEFTEITKVAEIAAGEGV